VPSRSNGDESPTRIAETMDGHQPSLAQDSLKNVVAWLTLATFRDRYSLPTILIFAVALFRQPMDQRRVDIGL
jgi:hypothetical protein